MWKASGSRNKWCSIACWKEYSNTFLFGKVSKLQKKSSLPVRPAVWCPSHFKPHVFRIFLLRVLKQNGDLSHSLVMIASNHPSPKTSKNMLRHWSQITLPETNIEGWKIHLMLTVFTKTHGDFPMAMLVCSREKNCWKWDHPLSPILADKSSVTYWCLNEKHIHYCQYPYHISVLRCTFTTACIRFVPTISNGLFPRLQDSSNNEKYKAPKQPVLNWQTFCGLCCQ